MKKITAPEAKTQQVARRDLAGGFHQADRVEDLLAAHAVMMATLVDDAGRWRHGGVGVMRRPTVRGSSSSF